MILMTELEIATQASREAGEILLKHFETGRVSAEEKRGNPRDIVTVADRESEKRIISIIKEHFPTHNVLAEESGMEDNNSDGLWVVDPLDGTSNFFKGHRDFCTLISFVQNGSILFGVTYFPVVGDMFIAERGKGATKNGKTITVSSEADVSKMYGVTQMTSNLEFRTLNVELYSKLLLKVRNIHVFGACIARGLCDIAEGVADFEFRHGFHYWDYAAGCILVEEAGGISTDFHGDLITQDTKNTLISNGKNHEELLRLVSS